MGKLFYKETTDYDVYASWTDKDGSHQEAIGSVELECDYNENTSFEMMPDELEINGFTYKLEV